MGRQKPGKPRRSSNDTHNHPGLPAAMLPHFDGPDPNGALFRAVIGAALESCTSCQDATLTLLVEDPATCARLVQLACGMLAEFEGGLPADQTDPDVSSFASVAFRRLARATQDTTAQAVFRECEQMTPRERRDAANTALDTLVGYTHLPSQDLAQLRRLLAQNQGGRAF